MCGDLLICRINQRDFQVLQRRRRQPRQSERFDMDTLIRAWTQDAAYQLHMEDEIRSLEVAKKADLVVLDRNLVDADSYETQNTQPIDDCGER